MYTSYILLIVSLILLILPDIYSEPYKEVCLKPNPFNPWYNRLHVDTGTYFGDALPCKNIKDEDISKAYKSIYATTRPVYPTSWWHGKHVHNIDFWNTIPIHVKNSREPQLPKIPRPPSPVA